MLSAVKYVTGHLPRIFAAFFIDAVKLLLLCIEYTGTATCDPVTDQ